MIATPPPLPPLFASIANVHTHVEGDPLAPAIVNLVPGQAFGNAPYYSVGIHPWDAASATDATFGQLRRMAADPRVIAIGEAGLDRLRGPGLDVQTPVFEAQARLAEELQKPLIIHMVRTAAEVLAIRRRLSPQQPWILHGFAGKPTLARQLAAAGLYLSLGPRHNPDSTSAVPAAQLLRESDLTPGV